MFDFLFRKKPEPRKLLPGEFVEITKSLNAFDLDRFNIQGISNIPALEVFKKKQQLKGAL
jgi:hypothetical protein